MKIGKKIRQVAPWLLPMQRFTAGHSFNVPERNILAGYLFYMILGFLLLLLPWCQKTDVSVIDNLFTAVSAMSTTGLATVDIPGSYTMLGQCLILFLIQAGGIGYMTLSSYIILRATHSAGYTRPIINTAISRPEGMHLNDLVNNIIHFTIIFEAMGFLSLYMAFLHAGTPLPAWNAIFLSISSFCTAGISPFSDSLCSFETKVWVISTIAILSYAGALGFIVITDIIYKLRRPGYSLTFTSKVILSVTAVMTVLGTLALMACPAMAEGPHKEGLVSNAFFQTMSAMTTVGFNNVDLSLLKVGPILVFSLIMFIGASPSGTGGGVKCTSVTAVYSFIVSQLGFRRTTTFMGRPIPSYRIESALTSIIVYGPLIFVGCVILSYTEPFQLSQLLFEATSAIGTVGLSTGITSELSGAGKVVIIVLMYIGRVGVITFGTALIGRLRAPSPTTPPSDLVA